MTSLTRVGFIFKFVTIPYFIGWAVSSMFLPQNLFVPVLFALGIGRHLAGGETGCLERLKSAIDPTGSNEDPFAGVKLIVHRNGEAEPCGNTDETVDILSSLLIAHETFDECPQQFGKYHVEALLTRMLHELLLLSPDSKCTSTEEANSPQQNGFLGYCDMGVDKTPILLDHDRLIPVTPSENQTYLPCHFHTREGLRITSLDQFARLAQFSSVETKQTEDEQQHHQEDHNPKSTAPICAPVMREELREIHLYAVPAGRHFMFAPSYVGEEFHLPHLHGADNNLPLYLKVLSLSPRVFDIYNFFSLDESESLVKRALAETSETHRIKRSTTGATSKTVFERRTSESGFDTNGKVAVDIKKRCFKALGFDEYYEGHSDGLQILRYNTTKAYAPHLDWIDDPMKQQYHNFDSAGKGGNRFATILLYMSDLGVYDGGETVFVHALPSNDTGGRVNYRTALKNFQQSNQSHIFERGSWEEEMVARCRSRLSIRPNHARAVLFYSQHPSGKPDSASLHGGCPVLAGEKWAANLWVWNTPRQGYPGAPVNEKAR